MPKRIHLALGHPRSASLCGALAGQYCKGAREAGAEVRELRLGEISFDPVLHHGLPGHSDRARQELEPQLAQAQLDISWAELLVFVYPTWWGSQPALLKGYIDRVYLSGFAYRYRKDSPLPEQLLKGKTARLLVTMDSPSLWNALVYRGAGHNMMRHATLGYCGVKPVRISEFDRVRYSSPAQREQWLARARALGAADARLS